MEVTIKAILLISISCIPDLIESKPITANRVYDLNFLTTLFSRYIQNPLYGTRLQNLVSTPYNTDNNVIAGNLQQGTYLTSPGVQQTLQTLQNTNLNPGFQTLQGTNLNPGLQNSYLNQGLQTLQTTSNLNNLNQYGNTNYLGTGSLGTNQYLQGNSLTNAQYRTYGNSIFPDPGAPRFAPLRTG